MKRLLALLALAACSVTLAACSTSTPGPKSYAVTPALTPKGERWPLTVDKAVIVCGDANRLVLAVPDESGTWYWLNGLAKGTHKFADLTTIWKDDPDLPGSKIGMWLTEYGNQKCGN